MNGFTAHQLRFDCDALEPMELYEWQGSGLRVMGDVAVFVALRSRQM